MFYPLYWFGSSNFGDAVNTDLYHAITGCAPVWSDKSPKIIAIGSLAQCARPGDIIWGAGCMSEDAELHHDHTTRILATRGPLTDKQLGSETIHGDPVTLLPKFFPMKEEKKYPLGFIPHYADYEEFMKMNLKGKIINIFDPPLEVIKQVCQCERVISSSLHGVIVAEAYGIPAGWVKSDNVAGNGFKFRDYYLGTGRDVKPIAWSDGFDWQEPTFDNSLLSVCPFNWDARWENNLPDCSARVKRISELIPPGVVVLDIGAGKMELENFLKCCTYLPTDFIKRRKDTILIDVNGNCEFPYCDIAVFSGILEYIKDIPRVLGRLNAKTIIASYMTIEMNSSLDNRRYNGWVNDFTEDELIKLFSFCGFKLDHCETLGTQVIFKFQSMRGVLPSCAVNRKAIPPVRKPTTS